VNSITRRIGGDIAGLVGVGKGGSGPPLTCVTQTADHSAVSGLAASRSTEDGAEAWGAAGAQDGPMAGSQDRRFPRAGMENSLYINGD
jgi:hypothetical protein